MPTFNSLPLRHEPKSIHTYDISATSINGGLGTFNRSTKSETELETWLSAASPVQGTQHAGPPSIFRLMQVVPLSPGFKVEVRTNANGLPRHLQCEASLESSKSESVKSFAVSLSEIMCKRICKSWALPVDLSAWLGEVSDRVISVVDEEGSCTVKQSCK
jgi:hypothetical protein